MNSLNFFHKSKGFVNKIDLIELKGQKIVATKIIDNSVFWVYSLASDSEMVYIDDVFMIYYSEKFHFYTLYFIESSQNNEISFFTNKNDILKNNYFHYLICETQDYLIKLFEESDFGENFDYSILTINSEVLTELEPYDFKKLKKFKYFFSCTNLLSHDRKTQSEWLLNHSDKMIMDFKYSLAYFYYKFGFCYYQKGNQELEISNRKDKVFLYSKHSGEHTDRYKLIKNAISTGKILEKPYTSDDWFWYFVNYNYYHMPYFVDYNSCKFNLIMETQPPNLNSLNANQFASEKTLKGLMVSTPCYISLQSPVYESLKDYGFYLLNEEFGEYTENSYQTNYNNFCNWLTNCSDFEFNEMFEKCYEKSKNNKTILEKYLYGDKIKEIELLLRRDGRVG